MSSAAQIELGSVVSLWRYPVKSMMGEELERDWELARGNRPLRRIAPLE